MIQIGDKVEVIDELIKGVVKNIVQNQIRIKTDDGLEFLFDKDRVVKINEGEITLNIPQSEDFLFEKEEKKTKKNYSIPKKDKNIKIMEIDLHIEQLVDNPRGMQNYEILTKQLNVEYLLGRYNNISYYDADYAKYGQGATEVYIHQSKR